MGNLFERLKAWTETHSDASPPEIGWSDFIFVIVGMLIFAVLIGTEK